MSDFDVEDFAQQIADQAESFLVAIQGVSRGEAGAAAVPLLLLEVSQIMLAGARLGAQQDFVPEQEFQPDVGPDPDLDRMRLRLADILGDVDLYGATLEPYDPETTPARISDDLSSIATDVANGLRHFRDGDHTEALWWWQYSYLSSWGTSGSGVLSALHSVVAHSRLDRDLDPIELEEVQEASAMLDSASDRG
ncbi:DUF5063 domain-containing protein [Nocardioides mangrovicus]|uniref:DUF5063 domain-containing protein n=1 Tax=Nocardioides mangrovicus TaxID=2478913 RepID=A0A3L8NZ81_9ACTN|nr:DUF5063 domain-containing protein [Nocardioides mangrovicus]RLV48214.1 DUF5063 domain-containing protein [Nocardioides mangrovicus]